ncbi:MAG: uroporphyrinogen decarboxylase family protein [Bacteroidota bacterium]
MTHRERILSILQGVQPDYLPWCGDLDYWANSLIKRGLKPEGFIQSEAYIQWHRDLNVGFYLQGYFPYKQIIEHCEVIEWNEGHKRYKEIKTAIGSVRECWEYIPDSYTEGPVEHFLKTEADLPVMKHIYENTRFESDYDFAFKRKQQVGDQGVVLCYLPKSPFMHLLALEAGVMSVTMVALTMPGEFQELLDVMKKAFNQAAQIAVDSPVDVLMIPENLSSEMVGPDFFEMYMRAYQEEWTDKIEKAGKYSFIHIDGTLAGLLKQEASVGFSVLEALTPHPVGDLKWKELGDFVGNSKSIMWGGIPGTYFTSNVSEEEFERHVKQVIGIMVREPRYVLGVADQVPPDGLEERVKRVGELVEQCGKY